MLVCHIGEKPSIAEALARILSGGRFERFPKRIPVYEFSGHFQGAACVTRVSAVTGHVFSLDFPPELSSWESIAPAELFTAPVVRTTRGSGGGVVSHLREVCSGASVLVLWLDCDREGENICFEVLDCVADVMPKSAKVLRAHFSSLAETDVQAALASLGPPNLALSQAVDARQEIDLKVGVAFSRFQTMHFQGKYADLDAGVVSYGPCQTPTLGFCVDRDDIIRSFTPEGFWVLDFAVAKLGQVVSLVWDRARIFDAEVADVLLELVREDPVAVVCDTESVEDRLSKPLPYNTLNLLKACSAALHIPPASVMHIAEKLYLSGYTSYPRTESTQFAPSYDLKAAVSLFKSHSSWGSYASHLLASGIKAPRTGVDAHDHPPILPVRSADRGELSGDMWRVYELITTRFLAAVSPDCVYIRTSVRFSCGGERFHLSGKTMVSPGFTAILPHLSFKDSAHPEFVRGEKVRVTSVSIREGITQAPAHLSESELISMMEKHGIGTDASIASHIENVCARGYVEVHTSGQSRARVLVPTDLGILLVRGYRAIDPDLVLPNVRAAIEEQCSLIAAGSASKTAVVAHALATFQAKFRYFEEHIGKMDALFECKFISLGTPTALAGAGSSASPGQLLTRCGNCNKYLRYLPLRPHRLHCETCNCHFELPPNGTVKEYQGFKCPLDGFELVLFSTGNSAKSPGRTYPLCPRCFNHPLPDIEGGSGTAGPAKIASIGCNSCTHPTCRHSMIRNAVCRCQAETVGGVLEGAVAQCAGTLVFDPTSRPNWKLCCNRCACVVTFNEDVHSVATTKERCCECDSTLLRVDFKRGRSLLDDATMDGELTVAAAGASAVGAVARVGDAADTEEAVTATVFTACPLCDDLLNSLLNMTAGRLRHVSMGVRRGRGRGRGGRRGRGRDRGEAGPGKA